MRHTIRRIALALWGGGIRWEVEGVASGYAFTTHGAVSAAFNAVVQHQIRTIKDQQEKP